MFSIILMLQKELLYFLLHFDDLSQLITYLVGKSWKDIWMDGQMSTFMPEPPPPHTHTHTIDTCTKRRETQAKALWWESVCVHTKGGGQTTSVLLYCPHPQKSTRSTLCCWHFWVTRSKFKAPNSYTSSAKVKKRLFPKPFLIPHQTMYQTIFFQNTFRDCSINGRSEQP